MPAYKDFTKEQRKQIVSQYKTGGTAKELAEIWKVSVSKLYNILKEENIIIRKQEETKRKYSINHDVFADAENNPEAAYWVGFLMADGCIGKDRPMIHLAISEVDHSHVEKFRNFLKADYLIKVIPNHGYEGGKNLSKITITSRKIIEDLAKYGVVSRKTGREKVKL